MNVKKIKYSVIIIVFLLVHSVTSYGQQTDFFEAEAFPDTVLMGNFFSVFFNYTFEAVESFQEPEFKSFSVVEGPNEVGGADMMGSDVIQEFYGVEFVLTPLSPGEFFIQPATLKVDGVVYKTDPIKILVLPNPEGIIHSNPSNYGGDGEELILSGGAKEVNPNDPNNSAGPPPSPMDVEGDFYINQPGSNKMKKLNKQEKKELFEKFEPARDSSKLEKKKKKVS